MEMVEWPVMEWLAKMLAFMLVVTLFMLYLGGGIEHGVGASILLRGFAWWVLRSRR